jgi:hypothetical protein
MISERFIPVYYQGNYGTLKAGEFIPATDIELKSVVWQSISIPTYRRPLDIDYTPIFADARDIICKLFDLNLDIYADIVTLWSIATWKVHNFYCVPFLLFSGDHDTGKTNFLRLLARITNKGILSGGATAAVVPRFTHNYGLTVLLDEADILEDNNDELISFCRNSYKVGSMYYKSQSDSDTEFIGLRNFGFKAFTGRRLFKDDALSSRCIDILCYRGVPQTQKLEYLNPQIDSIRDRCLLYSLNEKGNWDLGNDYHTLTGRTRELYEPLILVAKDLKLSQGLITDIEKYALSQREDKLVEEYDEKTYQIVKAIHECYERFPDAEEIFQESILDRAGYLTTTTDDKRKSAQTFGYFCKDNSIHVTGVGFPYRTISLRRATNVKSLNNLFQKYGFKTIKANLEEKTINII